MAYHFSANQYEKAYTAKRLSNWELPRCYPSRPRQLNSCSKTIANDNGHLLPGIKRDKNPWGNFRTTYMLPDRLTRRFAEEYHECLVNKHKWRNFSQTAQNQVCLTEVTKPPTANLSNPTIAETPHCPTKCETAQPVLRFAKDTSRLLKCKKANKSEYIPGDLTPYQHQHPSRQLLLQQSIEQDKPNNANLPLDHLHTRINKHDCQMPPMSEYTSLQEPTDAYPFVLPTKGDIPVTPITPPPFLPKGSSFNNKVSGIRCGDGSGKQSICCSSPTVPACANFELAKRMHYENLNHQPLPDYAGDSACQKLQLRSECLGQVKNLVSNASGVVIRTHNVGPIQRNNINICRPKTAIFVPNRISNNITYRPFSSKLSCGKIGAMDLAIRWDDKTPNDEGEAQPTRLIDGLNGSVSPAVFNFVRTPRDQVINTDIGHSDGIFGSTYQRRFQRDNKTNFTERPINRKTLDYVSDFDESNGHSIQWSQQAPAGGLGASRACKISGLRDAQTKLRQFSINSDKHHEAKYLRAKYLNSKNENAYGCLNSDCLRQQGFQLRYKIAPEPICCLRREPPFKTSLDSKTPFRAGVPKTNAAGDFVSSDSCNMGGCHATRVLVIPQPRNPYIKKNYDIETLAPPFSSHARGAAQNGYPEHWRLSSVYQHAFKPLEQRKRPLLQTVYK